MSQPLSQRSSRPVAIWLLVGVGMIIIQVLLGGITRLTGSGLSITEWKPIMGALPPMSDQDWNDAFDKYKQIAQYKYVNFHFSLSDFKFIFYWEWIHRLWARLIGVVFLIPFLVFWIQRRFKKDMIRPMVILFLLGALQGLVGWIMVQSGLEDSERLYVSHYKLAIHFILALGLAVYTEWFALELLVPKQSYNPQPRLKKWMGWLIALLVVQLIYGAFMAGLKAAVAAPTWPMINDSWWPINVHSYGDRHFSGLSFLTDHPLMVHFIHRNLAYLISVIIFCWWWKARKSASSSYLKKVIALPPILVLLQVILGILTVLNPLHPSLFLWLGITHQFVAMLLLLTLVGIYYLLRSSGQRQQSALPVV